MRIAYYLELGDSIEDMLGVIKKIDEKLNIWQHHGHIVHLFLVGRIHTLSLANVFSFDKVSIYSVGKQKFKGYHHLNILFGRVFPEQRQAIFDLAQFQPDVFYFRSIFPSPIINYALKNHNCFFECNTYIDGELDNIASKNILGVLYKLFYLRNRNNIYCRTKGVLSLTYEIANSIKKYNPNVNLEVVPNGISLKREDIVLSANTISYSDPIKMVFIGSPGANWHGLDHILEFARINGGKVNVDIIGFDGEGLPSLNNVRYHGILPRNKYEKIIEQADIGLGTFALYRKQMDEACPLKVREYLKFGLPVVLGYSDTAFINKEIPFVYQVPNTADGLISHANEVIDFCNIRRGKKLSIEEVRPLIDTHFFEEQRLKFIERTLSIYK